MIPTGLGRSLVKTGFPFCFQDKKKTDSVGKSVKSIIAEAERLEVKEKAVLVLAELLFDEDMLNQIKKHSDLFKKVHYRHSKV